MNIMKLRRSTTPGAVPPSLHEGEVAINLADQRIYVGLADGSVADLFEMLMGAPKGGKSGNVKNATVIGGGAQARMSGSLVRSLNGDDTNQAQRQTQNVVIGGETNASTPETVLVCGSSESGLFDPVDDDGRIYILKHHATAFSAQVVAGNDANGDAAFFDVKGLVRRGDGPETLTFIGTPLVRAHMSTRPEWAFNVSLNNTLGTLRFQASQGGYVPPVSWIGSLDLIELSQTTTTQTY